MNRHKNMGRLTQEAMEDLDYEDDNYDDEYYPEDEGIDDETASKITSLRLAYRQHV